MIKIAPSILSADFGRLAEQIKEAESAGADMLHLDIIDGHFAPNITYGIPVSKTVVKHASRPCDAHLMVTDPENFVDQFIMIGVDFINFHLEIGGIRKDLGKPDEKKWVYLLDTVPKANRINRLIDYIRDAGVKPALTLNPPTEIEAVYPFLEKIDILMLMSVNPGFSGQAFIDSVYDKIKAADDYRKKHNLSFEIMIDGGVGLDNAKKLHDCGADILVSGSSFFKSDDYSDFVKSIKS